MTELFAASGREVLGDHPEVEHNYVTQPLDRFLRWARRSVGSWCVIDHSERRIITSPGFIGTFLDLKSGLLSPEIGDIVRRRSLSGERLLNDAAVVWLLANTHGRSVYALAPSTVIADTRLLSGALVATHSKVWTFESYLRPVEDTETGLAAFKKAMLDTASVIDGRKLLQFSGGKDSLVIALALREVGASADTHLAHFDSDSKGTRPEQAIEVGQRFGLSVEVVRQPGGWEFGLEERSGDLRTVMGRNLVMPSWGQPENAHGLSGQNMDSMLSFFLPKPPQSNGKLNVRSSLRGASEHLRHRVWSTSRRIVERGEFSELAALLYPPPRGTAGLSDVVLDEVRSAFNADERILRGYVGERSVAKLLYFYLYPAWSNMLSSAPVGGHYSNCFVNNGPFLPFWAAPLSMRDFQRPKHLVESLIEDLSGKTFRISPAVKRSPPRPLSMRALLPLRGYLDPSRSVMLEHLTPPYRDWYRTLLAGLHADLLRYEDLPYGRQKPFRKTVMPVLNLEILLATNT